MAYYEACLELGYLFSTSAMTLQIFESTSPHIWRREVDSDICRVTLLPFYYISPDPS